MYWRGPVLWQFRRADLDTGENRLFGRAEIHRLWPAGRLRGHAGTAQQDWLFALDVPDKLSVPATLTYDFQLLSKEPVHARMRYAARSDLVYHANIQESERQLQRALHCPGR